MAFKLRSGNKTNFKSMGSSPVKQKSDTTKTYPKSYTKEDVKFLEEQREDVVRYEDLDKKGQEIWKSQGKPVPKNKKSPNKQRVVKGGEGQDQDKIFNEKGEHVGNWVNDKKVMFDKKKSAKKAVDMLLKKGFAPTKIADAFAIAKNDPTSKKKKSPAKQAKRKGFGPRSKASDFGGVDNPEMIKNITAGAIVGGSSKKVFKDGGSNRAHYKGKVVKGWTNPYAVKPKRKK